MGLFDKFKKKAAPASPSLTPPFPTQPDTTLKLLFSRQLPVEELTQAISRRFGSEAVARVDQLHPAAVCLLLRIDGVELWCSYMAFPLPPEEGDLRELLPHSLFVTPEEGEAMLGGKAFFVAGQKELGADLAGKRRACILLSRLCGALMELPGAQGCLNSGIGLLLGRRFYLHHAEILEREKEDTGYFPAPLWIALSQAENHGHRAIGTDGLRQFGFYELFFLDPKEEWAQSYEKLYMMSILQITGRELYRDRDTIRFGPEAQAVFRLLKDRLAVVGDI